MNIIIDNSNNILESLKTSTIDKYYNSNSIYQQSFVVNNSAHSTPVLTTIINELKNCDEFIISVAFITQSGVSSILETLKILEEKNIPGKILTGDYQTFTQPKALERLLQFKNIELKLFSGSLHTKGYFFKKNEIWNFIIGSSNLTVSALKTNLEWNLKFSSTMNGKIYHDIMENFDSVFSNTELLTIEKIHEYKKLYESKMTDLKKIKELKENFYLLDKREELTYVAEESLLYSPDSYHTPSSNYLNLISQIKPNSMQTLALENLENLRECGKNKALLISATGTGKTYLSAFDVREFAPKKTLFIIHREKILKQAMKTFKNIIPTCDQIFFRGEFSDIYTDKIRSLPEVQVFATIQTLYQDKHLQKFDPKEFDYIIIDEVHHSGGKSYQKIIEYFKPKFLLGMTATPERTDNFNIFELFDYNIASEIRLHDALNANLLSPFHYFGISDIEINGEKISDRSSLEFLTQESRVNHIIEKANFYGYYGDTLHGLIFVSSVYEAVNLSEALNKKGVKTVALCGKDHNSVREESIVKLENGELQYIISVDIFNEGIDIPCVNQVLLLRPTESAIIYVQQLGRGLRKYRDKEYVVILDFIGNYEKNFLVPVALSQDNSYNRDNLNRFILNGTNLIPGESIITFEEIVKERIFENINSTKFSNKKNIEHDFNLLKNKLGYTPYLNDFFRENLIDPSVILKYKNNYNDILEIFSKDEYTELTKDESNHLNFLSKHFTPAKRVHEMFILKYMIDSLSKDSLDSSEFHLEEICHNLETEFSLKNQIKNCQNAIMHLEKEIFKSYSVTKPYLPIIEKVKDDSFSLSPSFKEGLKNENFKTLIKDLIDYNLGYVKKNFEQQRESSMLLYKYYTKEEAFRYLNLDYNNGYQVGGYTVFEKEKMVPVFITLDDSSSFTSYDNKFYSPKTLNWFSKNSRTLSRGGRLTHEGKIANGEYRLEFFVKKTNGDNFYYLGPLKKVLSFQEKKTEDNKNIVEYNFELEYEVEIELFNYFTLKKSGED